jgi:hypothetical protein
MARPARPDEFQQINFITNFYLLGCNPPLAAIFEFAREPLQELAFFIFTPDLFDIAQETIAPTRGRRRKPARHGRKRKRGPGLPDTSAMIGGRLNKAARIGQATQLTPLRWMLPLFNIWEGTMFTVAVVEGLTNSFFEGVLGVVTIGEENCEELDICLREPLAFNTVGGAGPNIDIVPMNFLIRNQGFLTSPTSLQNLNNDYIVYFSLKYQARTGLKDKFYSLALGPDAVTRRYETSTRQAAEDQIITQSIGGQFYAGENCVWGMGRRRGFAYVIEGQLLAFNTAEIPWW